MTKKNKSSMRAYFTLLALTLFSLVITFQFPPTPQWASYHQFADTRTFFGIPNFWNVVSNLPFLVVAILGLRAIQREWNAGRFSNWMEMLPFLLIFLALILTAIGSTYYHLKPDNNRLVWDRIPLIIVFMAFAALIVMERINFKVGLWLLPFLIALGTWSVWYWISTERLGRGDLRPYAFMHFYSVLAILMILYLFPKPYPSTKLVLWLILFYGIAMLCEALDWQIYRMGGVVSGHTLKHLFAAISTYFIVLMVNKPHLPKK